MGNSARVTVPAVNTSDSKYLAYLIVETNMAKIS